MPDLERIRFLIIFQIKMANNKSSRKDIRRTARRTEQNRTVKSRLKTLSKNVAAAKDADEQKKAAAALASAMDKASKSGIIHKNKASRIKSRLAKAAAKTAAAK